MGASPNVKMCTLQVNLGECFFWVLFYMSRIAGVGKPPLAGESLADERFLVYNERILKIKEFKEI